MVNKELKKYYLYLEELRESGETNMFGAVPYLVKEFNINEKQAADILYSWMNNYKEISAIYYKHE